MGKKLTKEIFIERSIEKHGNIFDYSKVIFKNTKTKVEIVCNDHGSFYQPPGNHMMGQQCPSCSGRPKITTKTFIENSRIIHGNKYDYSKVNYINNKINVEIICNTHGSFRQIPSSHLGKRGCPSCSGNKKITTKTFIEKSRLIHGDKYDYSKVNYVNGKTNVTVICKIHGEFYPRPGNHTNSKSGCPKCSIIKQSQTQTKTTEQFIKDSIKVHGNRYDYSKVNYVRSSINVSIICKTHGDFLQTPNTHLKSETGCPKCSIIEQHEKQKKTTEEFIKDSIKVHGDRYDYSKVNYIDSNTKVNIVCKTHGLFNTDPVNHVYSESGCPECKIDTLTKSTEEFIKESIEIHGDLYDYSKVNYVKHDENVIIICKKHGEFLQKPKGHTGGGGCQTCSYSKGEKEIVKYLKKHKINYIPQKSFDDLKYKYKLRVDFYIPTQEIVIEYNGEQHYKPNEFFGGEKGFKESMKRDKLKEIYCKKNNIIFEIIRYDEDVISRMNQIFK
jgi:hypothetical protein